MTQVDGARRFATRWLLILGLLTGATAMAEGDDRLERSRQIAALFQQQLGAGLMAAVATGGPAEGIAACAEQAPEIAARLSKQSGVIIGRTALRVRNPDNAADAGQRALLAEFERALAAGADEPPEHFQAAGDGSALYLRAIVTQQMCLTCHGSELAPPVQAALARHYPADQATGFAAGDLRGAFVIRWPPAAGPRQ